MAEGNDNRVRLLRGPLLWCLLALVVRLLYLQEQQATSVLFYQPLLDEEEMVHAARQLLAGQGFGAEPLFKAPLYPLYLAAVMAVGGGSWCWLARFIQHALGSLLVLLAFDAGRRLGGAGRQGRLAAHLGAAVFAFYGPLVRLEDCLILDFFAVFLQSAMLWALLRCRLAPRRRQALAWAAAAGTLALLAVLNRPTVTPVLPFLALALLLPRWPWRLRTSRRHRALAAAGLFLLLPMLGLVGCYLRNASVGGEGMLLPWQGGYNLYHANRAGASGRYYKQEGYAVSGTGNPTRVLAEKGFLEAVARGDLTAPPPDRRYHAMNAYWFGRARAEILHDPGRWLKLMAQKAVYLVTAREIFNFEDYATQRKLSAVLPCLPLNFGLLWPLCLAGVALLPWWPRRRRGLAGLLWLYLLLLGGAIGLYYTSGRLRLPLLFPVALLAAGAAAAAVTAWQTLARDRRNPAGAQGSGFRVQGGGTSPEATESDGARSLTDKTADHLQHGSPEPRTLNPGPWTACRALAVAALLVGVGMALSWGDWWGVRSEPVAHLDLARLSNAAWRDGDYDRALRFADSAEAACPGYPTTPLLRGQALYSQGNMAAAAAAFAESMKRLPDDATAPFNLGVIRCFTDHQPARGLACFLEALKRQPGYANAAWHGALAALRLGEVKLADELVVQAPAPDPERAPPVLLAAAGAWAALHGDAATDARLRGALLQRFGDPGVALLQHYLTAFRPEPRAAP